MFHVRWKNLSIFVLKVELPIRRRSYRNIRLELLFKIKNKRRRLIIFNLLLCRIKRVEI